MSQENLNQPAPAAPADLDEENSFSYLYRPTQGGLKPRLVAEPLVVAQRVLERLSVSREQFGRLEDFMPDAQRARTAAALGGSSDRFTLGHRASAGSFELRIKGAGSVILERTEDRTGYVLTSDCLKQQLDSKEPFVGVQGERNLGFGYEQAQLKWTGQDERAAGLVMTEAVELLVAKAKLDKALDAGLVNQAWFEADKARFVAAGSGQMERGEFPAMGRDKNDGDAHTPFGVRVALVSAVSTPNFHSPGVFLTSKAGVSVFLVPRTDILLAVEDGSLKGRGEGPLRPGQHVELSATKDGRIQATPLSREAALERLVALSVDTPDARAYKEAQASRLVACAEEVLKTQRPAVEVVEEFRAAGGASRFTAEMVEALVVEAKKFDNPTPGPLPDPLGLTEQTWVSHPLYEKAEELVQPQKRVAEPARIEAALAAMLSDPRREEVLRTAVVADNGIQAHAVGPYQDLSTPARRRFERLGKDQGYGADTSSLGPEFYRGATPAPEPERSGVSGGR